MSCLPPSFPVLIRAKQEPGDPCCDERVVPDAEARTLLRVECVTEVTVAVVLELTRHQRFQSVHAYTFPSRQRSIECSTEEM